MEGAATKWQQHSLGSPSATRAKPLFFAVLRNEMMMHQRWYLRYEESAGTWPYPLPPGENFFGGKNERLLCLTGPSWIALCFTSSTVHGQSPQDHSGTPPNVSVTSSRDTLPRNIATQRDGGTAYELNAILIEPHSFGDRVLQGKERVVLATLNVFGTTRLADVLARSPKAANEASVYDRNHRSGAFMMLGGIASLVAGGVASQLGDGGGSYPLWLGGTLLLGSGSVRMNRAIHALPRAVWWYNHDLVAGN